MTCMTLLSGSRTKRRACRPRSPWKNKETDTRVRSATGGTPEGEGLQRQSLGRSRRAKSNRRRRTACAPPFSSPGTVAPASIKWDCNLNGVTPETEETPVTDVTTSQDQEPAELSAADERLLH